MLWYTPVMPAFGEFKDSLGYIGSMRPVYRIQEILSPKEKPQIKPNIVFIITVM